MKRKNKMLIKKWVENKLFIILLSFLVVAIFAGVVIIFKSINPQEFREYVFFIGYTTPSLFFLIVLLANTIETVYVYEDRLEVWGIAKKKQEIYFSNVEKVDLKQAFFIKMFIIQLKNYYSAGDEIGFLYNEKNLSLIKSLVEKHKTQTPTENTNVGLAKRQKSKNALKIPALLVFAVAWMGLCFAISLMHPQMGVAEIGLLAIFIVIFLGMLTLAVFLWQSKFIIDGNKIETRTFFTTTTITKDSLKQIKLIDKNTTNLNYKYVVFVIPKTVSDDKLAETNLQNLEKQLRKDKRVIMIYYTDEIKTALNNCGWTISD